MSETIVAWQYPQPRLLPSLVVAHAVLQVLDLATTAVALSQGAVEANPVSATLIGYGWWLYTLVKLTLAASFLLMWPVVQQLAPSERRFVGAGMIAFALIMTAVVINNALIIA